MERHTDTIVAPITAPGRAAVALVRTSGPRATQIAKAVFAPWPDPPKPRQALYGRFSHGDDGLATLFPAGASYTGDQTVEFSLHGSPASVQALLQACLDAGARLAEPGEFTQRALLNGRIDLAQAEGVLETINADSDRQLAAANRLREGRLAQDLAPAIADIRHTLTTVEALTDFSEELGEIPLAAKLDPLDRARKSLAALLETEPASRILRQGVPVALAGLPNAGKSSLLNALLREDRAIVNPLPGTTRDTISESVSLEGLAIVLTDTAGLRHTNDPVEAAGIARSRAALAQAHLVLYLFDATQTPTPPGLDPADQEQLDQIPPATPVLLVANKTDLPHPALPSNAIPVSAVTGHGLAELLQTVRHTLGHLPTDAAYLVPRHYQAIREADQAVADAEQTLQDLRLPEDLAAVHLRAALRHLGEITGETASADVLDQIFSQFCIGK